MAPSIFSIYISITPWHAGRDQRPLKSSVVGRPILLALEEIDGSPSFLEKALQFLETYGEYWPPDSVSFLSFYVLSYHFFLLFIP